MDGTKQLCNKRITTLENDPLYRIQLNRINCSLNSNHVRITTNPTSNPKNNNR